MTINQAIISYIFVVCSAYSAELFGQLIEFPVNRLQNVHFRLKTDTIPITLPVWDDFSTSVTTPDTAYWVSNTGVFISPGIGRKPPTLNVATLDGWDAAGKHYSQDPLATGKTDSLVSRPIDLTLVPVSLRNTVFLSFFYQKGGLGDFPGDADSLILQFRKPDGEWETVWPLPGEPVSDLTDLFTQKIIQVTGEFFWDQFQFKFQAHGRQSGPFDVWHLDYIYLDKRRSSNIGTNYLDRAFTSVPTSILKPYTAIPKVHFFSDAMNHLDSSSVGFTNLESQVQPIEYSAIIYDAFTGNPVDSLVVDSAFLALRYPFGNRTLFAGVPDPDKFDETEDFLYLETRFYMDTGDTFLIDSIFNNGQDTAFVRSVDLRVNDTTRVFTVLDDYYAYDDGTAEFGAGINQINGRLVCRFVSIRPGIIESIDINFQNIGKIFAGTPIELFVLKDLKDLESSLLGSVTGSVQVADSLDGFVTYEFGKTIIVMDTFYIGFSQTSNDFLAVGLDKNNDNSDKIFFNVAGEWVQNTEVKGSLMMRPRFTVEIVNGINITKTHPEIRVYPNPTTGTIRFDKIPQVIRLLDLSGKLINIGIKDKMIDLTPLPPSVYILLIQYQNKWEQHKIILTK